MAFKRRKRAKYTWFPTIGSGVTAADNVSGRAFQITVPAGLGSSVIVSPLTVDVPNEGDEIDPTEPGTLAGVVGQEYFIRRIVGKCFVGLQSAGELDGDPTFPSSALVGVGIFIARASDADAGGGADLPIGGASLAELQENYGPLSEDAIRKPWIWRRTWVLGSLAAAWFLDSDPFNTRGYALFPPTNAQYGSIQDGPHIDAKTARRVKVDERLWLSVQATKLPLAGTTSVGASIDGYVDFRILAQLRRARNRGVF